MIDERLIFYEGKHVRLKTLCAQDVVESNWVGWFNDASMSEHNLHHYFPNTFEHQHDLLKAMNNSRKLQLGIIDRQDKDPQICGVVSLSNIDPVHRRAEIAGIQETRKTSANAAVFLESWALMIRHGFEQLGLEKIYGGTFHPYVTQALVRMFNFEVEGVRRRHAYKNGTYHDISLLAVFRDTVRYPEF